MAVCALVASPPPPPARARALWLLKQCRRLCSIPRDQLVQLISSRHTLKVTFVLSVLLLVRQHASNAVADAAFGAWHPPLSPWPTSAPCDPSCECISVKDWTSEQEYRTWGDAQTRGKPMRSSEAGPGGGVTWQRGCLRQCPRHPHRSHQSGFSHLTVHSC